MLARICPAAMIFTPSVGGLSHNIAEHTYPADVTAGANVLLQAALALATPVDAEHLAIASRSDGAHSDGVGRLADRDAARTGHCRPRLGRRGGHSTIHAAVSKGGRDPAG